MQNIGKELINWFTQSGRILPWRNTKNPYLIWISEIILQQTRVNQGLPYFERFITAFPDVQTLATAEIDAVLKMWEGLGYYARARHLHTTAQIIHTRFQNLFPADIQVLENLPGIGPYTARAIAAFAFDRQVAVLDGNVFRILSRILDDPFPINLPNSRKYYQQLADKILADHPGNPFNQAMMDLGATICLPQKPLCNQCPIQHHCCAFKNQTVTQRPVKHTKPKAKTRYFFFYLKYNSDNTLLFRQTAEGFWKGLWTFPFQEITQQQWDSNAGITLKHVFTHFVMWIRVLPAPADLTVESTDQWIAISNVAEYALPKAMHKILELLKKSKKTLFDC